MSRAPNYGSLGLRADGPVFAAVTSCCYAASNSITSSLTPSIANAGLAPMELRSLGAVLRPVRVTVSERILCPQEPQWTRPRRMSPTARTSRTMICPLGPATTSRSRRSA